MSDTERHLSRSETHDLSMMNHNLGLAYLAGLVDGEGSILFSVGRSIRRGARGQELHVIQYQPRLQIANCSERLLLMVRDFVGAGHVHSNPRSKAIWKTGYQYQLSGTHLGPLLKQLIPHLILKEQQARLVLVWIEDRQRAGTRPYSAGDLDIIELVKARNAKGLVA